MITYQKTVKVSGKGQITLPQRVRQVLDSDLVRLVAEDGVVRIEPVRDAAGILKTYAAEYVPTEEAREKAWTEVAGERTPGS